MNGPLYELKEGELSQFECFVGHRFSPESLGEEHAQALERALWTAVRKLKERVVLHENLLKHKRNRGENELFKRLEESVSMAKDDLKLLREILDRILGSYCKSNHQPSTAGIVTDQSRSYVLQLDRARFPKI